MKNKQPIQLSDHFGYRKLLRFTLPAMFGVDGIWFAILCAEVLALSLSIAMIYKYRERYHYM